ncbi:MAG: hypothetical protein ACT4N8_04405 [Sphingosinicella sp.]|uniref:hypothetical protein n=1 Tax=Sphingosinicella sp. TaxID=1917971 RepID=UPI00403820FB
MRPALLLLLPVMLLAAPAAAQPDAREAELARLVEGRIAGPPERCLNLRRARLVRIVNRTAFVFRASGRLYVSRPLNPEALDRRDTLVSWRLSPFTCAGDLVRMTDRYSGIIRLVRMGPFVPYRERR